MNTELMICGNIGMTNIETERRNRIRLSLFAYAYEFESDSLISDGEFDALALKIDKTILTGNKKLDRFFREHFEPHTGQWIHKHPELSVLKALYLQYKSGFKLCRVFGVVLFDPVTKKFVEISL